MWKKINERYSISDEGEVRNDKTNRILKPDLNCKGYKRVVIEYKGKHHFIHRLVATAFIPNPLNKPQVNHIDGNKLNNNSNNLEWVTNSENQQHSYSLGNWKKRIVTPEEYHLIIKYTSEGKKPKEIVKLMNLNRNTVVAIRQGFNNKRFI